MTGWNENFSFWNLKYRGNPNESWPSNFTEYSSLQWSPMNCESPQSQLNLPLHSSVQIPWLEQLVELHTGLQNGVIIAPFRSPVVANFTGILPTVNNFTHPQKENWLDFSPSTLYSWVSVEDGVLPIQIWTRFISEVFELLKSGIGSNILFINISKRFCGRGSSGWVYAIVCGFPLHVINILLDIRVNTRLIFLSDMAEHNVSNLKTCLSM